MACAALLTAGPAAGVNALSPRPSYLDPTVQMFAIFSNSHWVVGGVHASQFGGSPAPSTHGTAIAGNEAPHYMWAPTCTDGPEELSFHRTIWLPGPTESLRFYANPTGIAYWQEPFSSIKLTVNHTTLVDSDRSTVYEAVKGSAFRPGENDIHISVTKRADPRSVKSCGAHSSTRLGLQVALVGQGFPVDLEVQPVPADEKVQYIHIAPGGSQAFMYTTTVTNKGPSDSGAGQFVFGIQAGNMQFTTPVFTTDGEPFTCTYPTDAAAVCTYRDWFDVGKPVKIAEYWKVTAPTDRSNADVEQMNVGWGIDSLNEQRDRNDANDSTGKLIYFCYPQATTYGCDKN